MAILNGIGLRIRACLKLHYLWIFGTTLIGNYNADAGNRSTKYDNDDISWHKVILLSSSPDFIIDFPQSKTSVTYSQTGSPAFKLDTYPDLYNNADFRNWCEDFIAGNLEKVLLSVEANLSSRNPHPLADYVWVISHQVNGDIQEALKSAPSAYKSDVLLTADLLDLSDKDFYNQTINKYPYGQIKEDITPYRAYLWGDNINNIDPALQYDIVLNSLDKYGSVFRQAWSLVAAAANRTYTYQRIQKDLSGGVFDEHPAIKEFLEKATLFRPISTYDKLAAIDLFLKLRPTDAIAMRYKAAQLKSLERYELAVEWYEKSFQADPFYYPGGNLKDKAYCLAKIHRYAEARKVCEGAARIYHPSDIESWSEALWANALILTGDYGSTMAVLTNARKLYPNTAEISYQSGQLETKMQRYDHSFPYYKRAIELDPGNIQYRQDYINALKSAKKFEKAIGEFQKLEDIVGSLNSTLFDLKAYIFKDAEEYEAANDVLLKSVEQIPQSSWMARNLAWSFDELGKTEKALNTILRTIENDPYNSWSFDRLSEYLNKKYDSDRSKVIEELGVMAEKFPWQYRIWKNIAEQSSGTEEKIAVWKRAIKLNPDRLMPYNNLRAIMNGSSQWDEWTDMLEAAETGISENGSEADKVNIHFEKAIMTWQKMFKKRLSIAQLENTIGTFDGYLKAGGRAAAVYNYQSDLYNALGDKKKAAEVMTKALKLRPDARNYPITLITKYGGSGSIKYLYDWMMRDPFNRANAFAEISVKWSGSPISALSTMYRYDVDDSWVKSKAFELLGNSAKIYEDYYVNKSSLGHERYIGWYNSARHSAWAGSTQLEIDYETNTATIQFKDGTIAQRQDDIRSGKIRKIQIGDTWLTADYTRHGDLTKLETSAGKKISLNYNAQNEIISLTSSVGQVMNFAYNESGQMSKIDFKGVGKLVVDYDQSGNLLSTESFDESGEQGGHGLALQITQAFQELIGLTQVLARGYDLSSGTLPDLGIKDLEYERLQAKSEKALDAIYSRDDSKSRSEWLKTSLVLAEYLSNHTYMNARYGYKAASILNEAFNWIKENKNKKTQQYGVETIALFHKLLLKIRTQGVAMDYWNDWIDMQEWLQLQKKAETKLTDYRKSIEKLQENINASPIELLTTSEWLPKSFLQNDGYWRQFSLSAIIPRAHREGIKLNCMLYRHNGDLVLGTSKGLSVFRAGYWEWFGYNGIRSEWQTELSDIKLKGTSDIRALAETSDSTLLLGTPEGLLKIEGDYRGKQTGRLTEELPSPLVTHLVTVEDKVLVGTSKGAVWYIDSELKNDKNLPSDVEIIFMSYSPVQVEEILDDEIIEQKVYLENEVFDEDEVDDGYFDDDNEWVNVVYDEGNEVSKFENEDERNWSANEIPQKVLIGTNNGVFISIGEDPFTQLLMSEGGAGLIGLDNNVYLLKGKKVARIQDVTDIKVGTKQVEIDLFGNIVTSQANGVYGLAEIPVSEDENALTVMTDLGFSIYHNNHFEHFYLPDKQKARGLVNGADHSFAGWSDESVWVFEKGNIQTYPGHIYDIVSADSLGITLIADGRSLKYLNHDDPGGSFQSTDYYGSATSLALDDQNRIIANDGLTIVRYTYDKETEEFIEEELFYANQFEPAIGEKYNAGKVKNIQVANDGTVWVATKMSVFQYREDEDGVGTAKEFNYFRDGDLFPSRTHMIYRLIETLDGRILVVASNEGHLFQSGVSLKGGLLEWVEDEGRFIRLNTDDLDFNWVIHSYTAISETEAILGTTAGFARDKNGYIQDYRTALKDPSYFSLFDEHPNLFLGTKGARLGDLWLFGAGAGIVAYQDGNWFYPDRINQMLPKDIELRNYGSRHVNAVATDPNGWVYAGTDLGLLVYNSGGATPMSFLLNNYREQDAFVYHSSNKIMQERDILIDEVDKDTEAGKIIASLNANERQTKRLEKLFGDSKSKLNMDISESSQGLNTDSLTALIDNQQKQHIELLLQLEQTDPGIHQLMNIQPVQIASMRERFAKDECVVQFIPTKQKLFIQLLAKNKLVMREVNIGQDSLMRLCRATANYISMEINDAKMLHNLEVLYDNLLRPITDELGDYEKIFIVPALSMYYVPFSALVNRISDREFKYAVEDYNFGYISSTNLLSLLFKGGNNKPKSILLMGDSDGSLPAAREEVRAIGELASRNIIFTGKDVTLSNLKKNAQNSGIIHLATHGFLNERAPNKSNILLAQDKRLSLSDAFNLPLDNTDMVVLSACQTAKGGGSGMEYATIARAFTNAGASTVLATLWKVNDRATKELMVSFYGHFLNGVDKFTALANAQRELLASDNKFLMHPRRWAGFIPMGLP